MHPERMAIQLLSAATRMSSIRMLAIPQPTSARRRLAAAVGRTASNASRAAPVASPISSATKRECRSWYSQLLSPKLVSLVGPRIAARQMWVKSASSGSTGSIRGSRSAQSTARGGFSLRRGVARCRYLTGRRSRDGATSKSLTTRTVEVDTRRSMGFAGGRNAREASIALVAIASAAAFCLSATASTSALNHRLVGC